MENLGSGRILHAVQQGRRGRGDLRELLDDALGRLDGVAVGEEELGQDIVELLCCWHLRDGRRHGCRDAGWDQFSCATCGPQGLVSDRCWEEEGSRKGGRKTTLVVGGLSHRKNYSLTRDELR